MASERVERLRALADAWNRGDVDGVMAQLGPEFEFRPDPSFPDARPMSGEELRSWLHQWADTWAGSELELFDLEDHRPGATARARWRLQAPGSEAELPVADFTFVVWFDDADRPARCAAFFDHERALQTIRAR
jgi:hypothetical protein